MRFPYSVFIHFISFFVPDLSVGDRAVLDRAVSGRRGNQVPWQPTATTWRRRRVRQNLSNQERARYVLEIIWLTCFIVQMSMIVWLFLCVLIHTVHVCPSRTCRFPTCIFAPFKKSNATRLWSIIFLSSWICIHHVRYPWKACLFAFRLMPYFLGLFHWGVCKVSKLGAMSKMKSCKIDRIVWNMHGISGFVFSFCDHTYIQVYMYCPFIVPKSAKTKHNIITLCTFLPDNHNK